MNVQLIQDLLTAISGEPAIPGESLPDAWHKSLAKTQHSPLTLVINALGLPLSPTDLFIELETAQMAGGNVVAGDLILALSGSDNPVDWEKPLVPGVAWTVPLKLLGAFDPELADALVAGALPTAPAPKPSLKNNAKKVKKPKPVNKIAATKKSRSIIPLQDVVAFAGLALQELLKHKTLRAADLGELADLLGDEPSARHYQVLSGMTQTEKSRVYGRRNNLLRRLQAEGYIVRDPDSPHTKATYSWTGKQPDPEVYGLIRSVPAIPLAPESLTESSEDEIPLVPVEIPPDEPSDETHLCEATDDTGQQCAEFVEEEACKSCGGAHYVVTHEDDGSKSWLCSKHAVPCAEEAKKAAKKTTKKTPKKKGKKKRDRKRAKIKGDVIDQIARFVSRWNNVTVEGMAANRTSVSSTELTGKRILCPLWDVKPRMPARRGGDPRSWKNARRDLRNLPCPCGSGQVVKDCHNISQ